MGHTVLKSVTALMAPSVMLRQDNVSVNLDTLVIGVRSVSVIIRMDN